MSSQRPRNPYVCGSPVREQHFFGHNHIIEAVRNGLTHSRQNVFVLHGQRRIGKTSLLLRLRSDITLKEDFLPIFLDMQSYLGSSLTPARVLAHIAQLINNELDPQISIPTETDLAADYNWFHRSFLPEVNRRIDPRRLLLLVDEFDAVVPRYSGDELLSYFRTLIAVEQVQLAFVFVVGQRLDLLGQGHLSLFKYAQFYHVGRLNQQDTYKLLVELGQQGGISYTDEALAEIWGLTNGHPYLTQLLGFEMFDHLRRQELREAKDDDVSVCLERAMESGRGALDWLWYSFELEQQWVLSAVASLTERQTSVSDTEINEALKQRLIVLDPEDREDVYEQLRQYDYLIDLEQRYRLTVDLMRQWIARYHPLSEYQPHSTGSDAEKFDNDRDVDSLVPFISGKPVPPSHFVGRKGAISSFYQWLARPARTSIAMSGEHGIGKTSLLHYLMYIAGREEWGQPHTQTCFVFFDCQDVRPFTPSHFWRRVLDQLKQSEDTPALNKQIDAILEEPEIDGLHISHLLGWLDRQQVSLVLLLDGFAAVVNAFYDNPDAITRFLAGLRSLTSLPYEYSFALIIATSKPLETLLYDINREFPGSHFSTGFAYLSLQAFTEDEVNSLLLMAEERSGISFDPADRSFLLRLAGGHPALLQMAGAFLFEGYLSQGEGPISSDARKKVVNDFEQAAGNYFSIFWVESSLLEQTLFVLLILQQLMKQTLLPLDLTREQIDYLLDKYERDLIQLVNRGLVLNINDTYHIASAVFARWIVRNIEAEGEVLLAEHEQSLGDESLQLAWRNLLYLAPRLTLDPASPALFAWQPPGLSRRYELREELGRRANSVVYRAYDTRLQRSVAIKLLHTSRLAGLGADRERLLKEAQAALAVQHRHIVTIYDVIAADDDVCLVMEYIEGQTLADLLRQESRVPLDRVIALIEQAAEALDYAHLQGVVQRDIKPANLMVTSDGVLKLVDFGIAKLDRDPETTDEGEFKRTILYMSPEQVKDQALDGRSDLFSLATVAFEMLSGAPPWPGPGFLDVLKNIEEAKARPLTDFDIPDADRLAPVFRKALAQDPDDRYQSGEAFVQALKEASTGAPSLNPYIGPRPFQYGESLFGRDREATELLDLLVAERMVLLYGPSGVGKTSLIQAALMPRLEEKGTQILPVMRVGFPLPDSLAENTTANRYILSALLSLEKDVLAEKDQMHLETLAGLTLADYLDQRFLEEAAISQTLIFDQFEKILAVEPGDISAREDFFAQLEIAMQGGQRMVLFAVREEFVAGLEPCLSRLPTPVASYRLGGLDAQAAMEAIQGPARTAGVDFTDEAARKLVDELRRVRLAYDQREVSEALGEYVEPVLLQVACHYMWQNKPKDAAQIDQDIVITPAELAPELQNSMQDVRPWVREVATRQLGDLLQSSDKRVALAGHIALTLMAKYDDIQQVRTTVAEILEAPAESKMGKEQADHVFISYAREDQTYTRKLADSLRERGFEVWMWMDDRIDFGDRWWQMIVEAIRASAAFIVVMTRESETSDWVEREVMLALDEGKPIFPLLLRGRVFPSLITTQYTDVTGGRLPPDEFYDRLEHMVRDSKALLAALEQNAPGRLRDRLSPGRRREKAEMRQAIAQQLGEIGDPRAVGPLIAQLKDPETGPRAAAAQALGLIGDDRAVDALREALADSDPEVRQAAARALEQIEVLTWLSRLSATSRQALALAEALRQYLGHDQISTGHLLWGLYQNQTGAVRELLTDVTSHEDQMTVTVLDVMGETQTVKTLLRRRVPVLDLGQTPGVRSLRLLVIASALCNDAVLDLANLDGDWYRVIGDPPDRALALTAAQLGFIRAELDERFPRVAETPFTPERKRMTTVHQINVPPEEADFPHRDVPFMAFTKGAVDGLLELTTEVWAGDEALTLTDELRQRIQDANEVLTNDGLRVLGVAFRPLHSWPEVADEAELERDLTFIGLVGMTTSALGEWVEAWGQIPDLSPVPETDLGGLALTPNCQQALEEAAQLADDAPVIRERQVLSGLLAVPDSQAALWMADRLGVERDTLYHLIAGAPPDYPLPLGEIRRASTRDGQELPRIEEVPYTVKIEAEPEVVLLGGRTTITVELEPFGDDLDAPRLEVPAQDSDLGLFLQVPPGFECVADNALSLPLEPTADEKLSQERGTQRARFRLQATDPVPEARVVVEFLSKSGLQAEFPLVLRVGQVAAEALEVERSLMAPRPVPHPDLLLEVQPEHDASGARLIFHYLLEGPALPDGGTRAYHSKPVAAEWSQHFNRLLAASVGGGARAAPEEVYGRLAGLGQEIAHQLCPPELWQALTATGVRCLQVLAPDGAWLPWELLHDGHQFLGEQLIVGRWPRELNDLRTYEFAVGDITIAHFADVDQPGAWRQLLEPLKAPATELLSGGTLPDSKNVGALRGLHLLRRGRRSDEVDSSLPWLRESGDSHDGAPHNAPRDGPIRLDHRKLDLRSNRPLVWLGFLDAGVPGLTELERHWAAAFVPAGASAFVGPLWMVTPEVEAAFARGFYDSLWAGHSLGDAFRLGQRLARAAAPDSVDWMAYVLYGDPMARAYRPVEGEGYAVVEAVGREIEDPVRPGEAVRFRLGLRRSPPLWHTHRLVEVAEELAFENLQAHIATFDLPVTPDTTVPMRKVGGDYLGWFMIHVPDHVVGRSSRIQISLTDSERPVHTLSFSLNLGAPGSNHEGI